MDGMSGMRPGHRGHDTELVAALVTGGLSGRARLSAELLVRRCADCRTLREEYALAWARIGAEIEPVEPSADLRRRVLARVPPAEGELVDQRRGFGLRHQAARFS